MPISCSTPTTSFTTIKSSTTTTKVTSPTTSQVTTIATSPVTSLVTTTTASTCIYKTVTRSSPFKPATVSPIGPSTIKTKVSEILFRVNAQYPANRYIFNVNHL